MSQPETIDAVLARVNIPKPDEVRQQIAENLRQRQLLRQLLKLAEQRRALTEVSLCR